MALTPGRAAYARLRADPAVYSRRLLYPQALACALRLAISHDLALTRAKSKSDACSVSSYAFPVSNGTAFVSLTRAHGHSASYGERDSGT